MMDKTAIAGIVKEANRNGQAESWKIREVTKDWSVEDFKMYSDLQAAKDRLFRSIATPEQAAEHRAIAALICSQVGIDLSAIE